MKPPPSSPITSHVLDTALGRPARDLAVRLDVLDEGGAWRTVAERVTGDDGRVADLLDASAFVDASAFGDASTFTARTYRLTFATGAYFAASGRAAFYPRVEVIFDVAAPGEHYHIPLLLSPFGYSTYRGS
jgi:5-hydroxyisourate hydrolase